MEALEVSFRALLPSSVVPVTAERFCRWTDVDASQTVRRRRREYCLGALARARVKDVPYFRGMRPRAMTTVESGLFARNVGNGTRKCAR
jgi:hypothetical protein